MYSIFYRFGSVHVFSSTFEQSESSSTAGSCVFVENRRCQVLGQTTKSRGEQILMCVDIYYLCNDRLNRLCRRINF